MSIGHLYTLGPGMPDTDYDPSNEPRLFECDRLDCRARRRLRRAEDAVCTGFEGDRHKPAGMEAIYDDDIGEDPRAILLHEDDGWR